MQRCHKLAYSAVCHVNRAACYIQLQDWQKVQQDCASALRLEPAHMQVGLMLPVCIAALRHVPCSFSSTPVPSCCFNPPLCIAVQACMLFVATFQLSQDVTCIMLAFVTSHHPTLTPGGLCQARYLMGHAQKSLRNLPESIQHLKQVLLSYGLSRQCCWQRCDAVKLAATLISCPSCCCFQALTDVLRSCRSKCLPPNAKSAVKAAAAHNAANAFDLYIKYCVSYVVHSLVLH